MVNLKKFLKNGDVFNNFLKLLGGFVMRKLNKIIIISILLVVIGVSYSIKTIEDPYNLGLSKSLDKDYGLVVTTFNAFDENEDGKIDFNEYTGWFDSMDSFSSSLQQKTVKYDLNMVQKVFDLEDLNKDSYISPNELYGSFKRV
ncbi:EF hand [Methanobrevibacter cuticularis]|uniref:EF hand n=2 Tax=Methanobrevibacter cuticularis TaxID=47311 RepID=A0A166EEQ4_9EURY|nr:EF hand [Methanobrevibacter cuticularis]